MRFNTTKIRKFLPSIIAIVLMTVITISAYAYHTGITGLTATSSGGCSCHSSANSATTVSVSAESGNFTVNPGTSANFTVTVAHSSQSGAGTNIAVKTSTTGNENAGTLTPGSGSGLQSVSNELTHSDAKSMSGGQASFNFSWQAPNTPGTYYLRAAGNAVNLNSNSSGDVFNFMSVQAITVPGVSLTSADGGDSWCPGSQHDITWTSLGITNIKIELSSNGGSSYPTVLAASVNASANSWTWNIPGDLTPGNQYKIRISDASDINRKDESASNFTIATATEITTQPISQNTCTNQQIQFIVVADGGNLTYQWKKNGSNISGATNATLTLNNVQLTNAGTYSCAVSGSCGNPINSQDAVLTVDESPTIQTQPQSKSVCPGESVNFTVTATATNITYQWKKNGQNISGETTNSLAVNNVQSADAGNYSVMIGGKCTPALESSVATLTVNSPVSISTQPLSTTACINSQVQFMVEIEGSDPVYQWKKNGTNISGANTAIYIISKATQSDAGEYQVVINGACQSSVTSNKVTLTLGQTPQIITQPAAQSVTEDEKVTFKVSVAPGDNSFQWRKNDVILTGGLDSIYVLPKAKLTDAGSYDCVVTNDCGETISSKVTLTVEAKKAGPAISLAIDEVDFGLVNTGSTSDSLISALITNSGDQDLTVSAINITGASLAEFEVLNLEIPFTVKSGENKSLTLSFKPTVPGDKTAVLGFESNSNNSPTINLKGFAGLIKLDLSEVSINFQDIHIGTQGTQNLTITNNGNYAVTFNDIIISGTDKDEFTVDSLELPFTLEPSSVKTIAFIYSPTKIGTVSAEITLTNSTGNDIKISLSATGLLSSVEDLYLNGSNSLYPNPSEGEVNINLLNEYPGIINIKIIDVIGNTVKNFSDEFYQSGNYTLTWDGSDNNGNSCPSGYYRIILTGKYGIGSQTFMISK